MTATVGTAWELSEGARRNTASNMASTSRQLGPFTSGRRGSTAEAGVGGSILADVDDTDIILASKEAIKSFAASFEKIVGFQEGPSSGDAVQSKFRIDTETKIGFIMARVSEIKRPAADVLDLFWSESFWQTDETIGFQNVVQISPTQRIYTHEYKKQPMLSNRDVVKIYSRCDDDVPIMWGHSVVTRLVPPQQGVVRADTHVEGFVVKPLTTSTCEVVFVNKGSPMGIFDNKKCGKLMNCCGVSRLLSRTVCSSCIEFLLRLKQTAEAEQAAASLPTLLQEVGADDEKPPAVTV